MKTKKGFSQLWLVVLVGYFLISAAGFNMAQSVADAATQGNPADAPAKIAGDGMQFITNNITLPLWALLGIILLIMVIK